MLRSIKLLEISFKPLISTVRRYSYPKKFFDKLKLSSETCYTQMANGLTIASEERPTLEHLCVGLFIDAGSRYESKFENGIAHFFEHIAYKSTRCRSAPALNCQMAAIGARFKCFTTRELVGYYVECLSEDLCIVVDLLADCVFNNDMNNHEIEKQKQIVYQEMAKQDVNPNAILFDYLHGAAFNGTPLAQTVMGPSSNLSNFSEQTLRQYLCKFFDPTRTVLAAVGGVCHDQLVDLAQLYLLKLEPSKCVDEFYRFTAGDVRFRDDAMPYCNAAIAFEAPCICDDRAWVMEVAASLIGGWDRSQPGDSLNANYLARASYFADLAYGYRSFYIKYKDTGLWGVQFLSNKLETDNLVYNIQEMFMSMCTMLTENEVDRAKRELKAKLMTKLEPVTASCLDLGRWTLYYGRRPPLGEQLRQIEGLAAEDVRAECDYFLYDKCPAVAAVGPVESLPHQARIRSGQYWLRA